MPRHIFSSCLADLAGAGDTTKDNVKLRGPILAIMALIKCPACGYEVSERAARCPNCGQPIDSKTAKKKARRIWPWILACGLLVAALATTLVVLLTRHGDEGEVQLTFPEKVEAFADQVEHGAVSFSRADWSNASVKYDSLMTEYRQIYNSLVISDLDRVDDALDRYRQVVHRYLGDSDEDDSKIVVDDIEYAYETPTTSQLHEWRDEYARVCSSKLNNMSCQNYRIPDDMMIHHPCLVYLILKSRTMEEGSKRQDWFDLYSNMNDEQIDKLYDILYREMYKLKAIENLHSLKEQANQLNQEAYNYANSGDFFSAYQTIEKAIALQPNDANLYDSKGEFYLKQDRVGKAFATWKKVLELDPNFLGKHNGHTVLYDGLVEKGMITTNGTAR